MRIASLYDGRFDKMTSTETTPKAKSRLYDERFDKMNPFKPDYNSLNADRLRNAEYPRVQGPVQQTSTPASFVEQLKQALLTALLGFKSYGQGIGAGSVPTNSGSIGGRSMTDVAPQPVQARLDLRFENSTQLIVDGRILATVITPYLSSDLIKFEASQGSITKRYII
jgi:hypothetical protein